MSSDDTNIKINNLWERLCLGLLSFIVSCLFLFYQGQREDFKGLEEKVVTMQTGKVNKEDLREVEARLNTKMDAGFSNLIARSAQDKADVISRLDLYFSQVKNTKH